MFLKNLPEKFDEEKVITKHPLNYNESMNTVLIQEVKRYNVLIGIVK
jgi:dynein heavy chain